ncbi:hypothetical protein [Mycobacterium sp. Marseille-P9652]|uniref:hypothetical protein n=1 Tax=Mycobacterium sp. Marseille-P9652 TaxID=2654950 RepID=UPI0012E73D6A|nr:hypothetical protein [Mycobacterium sp. Marseille-P9652]
MVPVPTPALPVVVPGHDVKDALRGYIQLSQLVTVIVSCGWSTQSGLAFAAIPPNSA